MHPAIVHRWFDKRRGLALGLAVLGSGLGNLVVGIALERMITLEGFRFALRVLAGVSFAFLTVAVALVKRRLPPVVRKGILGDTAIFKDRNFRLLLVGAAFFQLPYNVPFSVRPFDVVALWYVLCAFAGAH